MRKHRALVEKESAISRDGLLAQFVGQLPYSADRRAAPGPRRRDRNLYSPGDEPASAGRCGSGKNCRGRCRALLCVVRVSGALMAPTEILASNTTYFRRFLAPWECASRWNGSKKRSDRDRIRESAGRRLRSTSPWAPTPCWKRSGFDRFLGWLSSMDSTKIRGAAACGITPKRRAPGRLGDDRHAHSAHIVHDAVPAIWTPSIWMNASGRGVIKTYVRPPRRNGPRCTSGSVSRSTGHRAYVVCPLIEKYRQGFRRKPRSIWRPDCARTC